MKSINILSISPKRDKEVLKSIESVLKEEKNSTKQTKVFIQ